MPSTTLIAPDDAVLSALTDVGVAAYLDPDDRVIYAHPTSVPQAKALDGMHVMIAIEEAWFPSSDAPPMRASAWVPDGSPDFHELGTVYASDGGHPVTEEAARCARATAEWFAGRLAGRVLLEALAEYGITPGDGLSVTYSSHSDTYDVLLPLTRGEFARLVVADRDGSVRHVPAAHTGWSVMLHDERGDLVGDPVFISGDGTPLDCAEDSAAAAAFIADFVTAPVSRHCDCYAQEGHGRRHDRECNRYRRP
ncbi:hypothetical protein ACFC07_22205 [Streptomyces sp. NPDC056099]|uniref:hypothetical protein n=1 Tax=unclassified Streptomyces TaxID=2593676 RepID=UPI0035DEEE1C